MAMVSPDRTSNEMPSTALNDAVRCRKTTFSKRILSSGPISSGFSGRRSMGFLMSASKLLDGRVHFPVLQDDIPHVLQRPENGGGDELHGDQLAGRQHVAENEPEQDEQDGIFEQVERGPLQERQRADLPGLLHLEIVDAARLPAESLDLLEGQAQALDQLDVPQGLGDDPRQEVGLAVDGPLDGLDLFREQAREERPARRCRRGRRGRAASFS